MPEPEEPTELFWCDVCKSFHHHPNEYCSCGCCLRMISLRPKAEPRAFVESDSVAPKTRYEPSLEDRANERVRKWRKRNRGHYNDYMRGYMKKRRAK